MKQRVEEMEMEAKKLREMQAAAEENSQDTSMDTEEDKAVSDGRSIYVGNVGEGFDVDQLDLIAPIGRLLSHTRRDTSSFPGLRDDQPSDNSMRQVHRSSKRVGVFSNGCRN